MSHTPPSTGWTGHLHEVKQPTTLPVNDVSRRIAIQHAMDELHLDIPDGDSDRILFVYSLLGEVVDAYQYGHKSITDEWVRVAAAVQRIVEADVRRSAR